MTTPEVRHTTTVAGSSAAPRALRLILGFGIAARVLHWWTVKDLPFFAQLVMDSQEYDRWANEIFSGDWLGSETFFQAPLYPYLLASFYSVFGRSYDAVYWIQILFSAVGGYAIYRAGRIVGGRRLGLAAAALLAGAPILPFYDVQLLKESFAVSTVCLLLWALIAARNSLSTAPWLLAGIATGVLILLRENALLLLPLLFLLTLDTPLPRTVGSWRPSLTRYALLLLGVVVLLSPVAIRNWVVGGEPLPTTFQGGTNFYIGNNPQADGTYRSIVKGKQIPVYERNEPIRLAEAELGRSLTPAEVSQYWLHRSLTWAKQEPLAVLALQLKKLGMFWSWYEWPDAVDYYFVRNISPILKLLPFEIGGMMLLAACGLWQARDRLLTSYLPVLLFIVGWTAATVIFFIFSRYRLPILPALALLAAVPVASIFNAAQEGRRGAASAGAALVLMAIVLPRLAMPEARMDLVHYNLGVIFQQSGRDQPAEHHFRETLRLDSENFLAAMNLGRLAAGRRDWQLARQWFLNAEAIEPQSDDVLLNLGAIHMAVGEPARAKQYLQRALDANAERPGILHNLALVELELWRAGQGRLDHAVELNRRVLERRPDHPQALALRSRLVALQESRPGTEDDSGRP